MAPSLHDATCSDRLCRGRYTVTCHMKFAGSGCIVKSGGRSYEGSGSLSTSALICREIPSLTMQDAEGGWTAEGSFHVSHRE